MLPAVEKRADCPDEDRRDDPPPDAPPKTSDRPASANPGRLQPPLGREPLGFAGRSDKGRQSKSKMRFLLLEEKDERSDRNQPKVLASSVRLPQVFGNSHGAAAKDSTRMSYNFKQVMTDYGIDKPLDRKEPFEGYFINKIKRPAKYPRVDPTVNSSVRPAPDEDPAASQTDLGPDPARPKKGRASKSCPRQLTVDKPTPR